MSFGEHLDELRRRLILALLTVAPIFLLTIYFGDELLSFILTPAQDQLRRAGLPPMFIATGPLETLGSWLKVALVVTIVLGVPAILFQLWLFVSPGLHAHERRFAVLLIPLSVVLSVLGLAFLYYVMLPAMLSFLIQFGSTLAGPTTKVAEVPPGLVLPIAPVLDGDPAAPAPGAIWLNRDVEQLRVNVGTAEKPVVLGTSMMRASGIAQQYRVSEYVNLVFTMSLAFVAGFQTPVVVLLLGWMGIVDQAILRRSRKYAMFLAFVVGALLTPSPDPFSMTILAVPLYALYELGMLLLRVAPASRVAAGFGRRGESPHAGGD